MIKSAQWINATQKTVIKAALDRLVTVFKKRITYKTSDTSYCDRCINMITRRNGYFLSDSTNYNLSEWIDFNVNVTKKKSYFNFLSKLTHPLSVSTKIKIGAHSIVLLSIGIEAYIKIATVIQNWTEIYMLLISVYDTRWPSRFNSQISQGHHHLNKSMLWIRIAPKRPQV